MLMKSTLCMLKYVVPVMAVMLAGCNSDVFIDNFLSDSPSITLSEEENDVTVHFEADNWNILSVEGRRSDVSMWVTDLEGEEGKQLPFAEGETGVVCWQNRFMHLSMEKRNGRELHFVAGENLYDQPFEAAVRVGNNYDQKTVYVSFSPTRKYQVDSVEYDWSQLFCKDNIVEQVDEMVINNMSSSQPVTVYLHPFQNAVRKVNVGMWVDGWNEWEGDVQTLLGDSLSLMEIPDAVNGKFGLYGTKVLFNTQEQRIETGLDKELEVAKSIFPGKKVCMRVFNCMEVYSVPYKAYISNSFSGKKLILSGTVTSSTPFDYLILPIEMTDENE